MEVRQKETPSFERQLEITENTGLIKSKCLIDKHENKTKDYLYVYFFCYPKRNDYRQLLRPQQDQAPAKHPSDFALIFMNISQTKLFLSNTENTSSAKWIGNSICVFSCLTDESCVPWNHRFLYAYMVSPIVTRPYLDSFPRCCHLRFQPVEQWISGHLASSHFLTQ